MGACVTGVSIDSSPLAPSCADRRGGTLTKQFTDSFSRQISTGQSGSAS